MICKAFSKPLYVSNQTHIRNVTVELTRKLHVGWEKSLVRCFGQKEVDQFVNLTQDFNPIHTDDEEAKIHGFSKPIVPGILLATMFPSIIGSNFPGSVYATQSLAFRGAVQVGETVEAIVKVTKAAGKRVIFQTVVTRNGQVVLDGTALAIMPSPLTSYEAVSSDPTN
mmetsp:Transcript_13893/g.24390  ORF Transcript_13893/g.24390 Transcript_13893/m.24390 type:complete len:168 (-) Transcript_13893:105-608(-)